MDATMTETFLESSRTAAALLTSDEVRVRWADESSCAGMTVGGLAFHLAASLDVPTPQFPDEAFRLVLGLLTSVAVERHGQTALVRALSRPQRAPGSVSAF